MKLIGICVWYLVFANYVTETRETTTGAATAEVTPTDAALTKDGEPIIYFEVSNQRVDVNFGHLKVIERSSLQIHCYTQTSATYYKWLKAGDPTFVVYSQNLTIPSVHLEHCANYSCFMEFLPGYTIQRDIYVDVLYPPTTTHITGPESVLEGHPLALSCVVDSNPNASYAWTLESPIANPVILSRDQAYVDPSFTSNLNIYCMAINTMIPTFGESVSTNKYATKFVKQLVPAHIWNLEEDFMFAVGDTLDVKCNAQGIPVLTTWWSKKGDDQFMYIGDRMVINNVQMNYTGHYTCWAENIINSKTITDSKMAYISIIDASIPEECQAACQTAVLKECAASISSQNSMPSGGKNSPIPSNSTTCNGFMESTPSSPLESTTDASRLGLIIAVAIGWFFVLVLLIVVVILWVKRRHNRSLPWRYNTGIMVRQQTADVKRNGGAFDNKGSIDVQPSSISAVTNATGCTTTNTALQNDAGDLQTNPIVADVRLLGHTYIELGNRPNHQCRDQHHIDLHEDVNPYNICTMDDVVPNNGYIIPRSSVKDDIPMAMDM